MESPKLHYERVCLSYLKEPPLSFLYVDLLYYIISGELRELNPTETFYGLGMGNFMLG